MRKPVIIAIAAFIIVIAAVIAVSAATRPNASSSDPVVRQSYTNGEYSQTLLKDAASRVEAALKSVYDSALQAAQSAAPAKDTTARHVVSKGGAVTLGEGASVVLASGKAELSVSSGTVADVTDGVSAQNGDMSPDHRYIVCTGGSAAVTVTERCVFITSGSVSVTAGEVPPLSFTDVSASAWYYNAVSYMVELHIMSGTSDTAFSPDDTLSLAQTICLAAEVHQLNSAGSITLKPDEDIWYMSYVKYAVAQGIIGGAYTAKTAAEYDASVSRGEFVGIMYKALPQKNYTVIGTVPDGSIPDVSSSSGSAAAIYAFYRAGIVSGGADGSFNPDGTVSRAQAAAIMAAMLDPTMRRAVTLK